MKIIIIKNNLKEALSLIERAVGENQNLPILKNILFDVDQNRITMTATNLEIAITVFVSGKIIEPGKTTIPAATFSSLVANIPTERLNIEQRKTNLEITTDNYEARIQITPTDDYPLIPKIKNTKHHLEIPGDVLRDALAQVVVAAQPSDIRPELSSVLFVYSVDQLTLAATDSFRLSERKIAKQHLKGTIAEPFKILVPLKTATELLRIIRTNAPVKMFLDENQVLFSSEQFECISRLLMGSFPEYENLIPKKFTAEITTSREELLNALKLAGVFSSRVYEVKIRAPQNQKNIEVFSVDQTIGENNYRLPAQITGGIAEICFNWRYLTDGLKTTTGESVFIGLNDENKPALIRSKTSAAGTYVLMPILKV